MTHGSGSKRCDISQMFQLRKNESRVREADIYQRKRRTELKKTEEDESPVV